MLAGALLVLGSGCGGSKPVKVEGKVSWTDGSPVKRTMVFFIPTDKDNGKEASGMTDDEGNFYLTTYSDGDGALPGTYKVVFNQTKKTQEQKGQQAGGGDVRSQYEKFMRESMGKKQKGPKSEETDIPDIYLKPETTDKTWTVPSSDSPNFKIMRKKK
jgi:hypothetical protein